MNAIQDYYQPITKDRPSFELEGIVFEAPKDLKDLTEQYCQDVVRIAVKTREAKRLGKLAFLYRDTYGLTEDTIFSTIKKIINSEDYLKNIEKIAKEESARLFESLKLNYPIN